MTQRTLIQNNYLFLIHCLLTPLSSLSHTSLNTLIPSGSQKSIFFCNPSQLYLMEVKPTTFLPQRVFGNSVYVLRRGIFWSSNDYGTLLSFSSRDVKYPAMHGVIPQNEELLWPKCQQHVRGETACFSSAVVIPQ